jgi:hypothetical protein
MPIYRLGNSGNWRKLSAIYRLGNTGVWRKIAAAYRLGSAGNWRKIFSFGPDTVTQTSQPTGPSGSGEAFTSVSRGSSGTYTNYNTGYGIVTKLVKMTLTTSPVSGTETKYGTDLTNTYTVTQADATTPVDRFYTQDSVKNIAGTKTFYFYSDMYVQAYVGNITDNYNRNVATGLGTSSSGYIYSSYANNTVSWQVNGSRADNSSAVSSGASATSHPLQTIEVGSSLAAKTNKTYSIDIPDGKGGQGVAFWATSANSWYAVTSYFDYDTSTTTELTCSGSSTWSSSSSSSVTNCNNANPTGSSVGNRCGTCVYNGATYPCTGTGSYSNTISSSTANCESANPLGSFNGDRCGSCTYTGSFSYLSCIGSGSYTSSSSSVQGCRDANPELFIAGYRCGDCSSGVQGTTCTGTGTYSNTISSSTTNCNTANPIGSNIGDACGTCTYTGSTTTYPCTGFLSGQSSCPSTGSGSGDRCSSCTSSTAYPCNGGSVTTLTCPSTGSLSGDRCTACTTNASTTTYGACRSTSLTPVCPSCPLGTTSFARYTCSVGFWQCRCVTPTTYTYTVRGTSTVYSYSVRQTLTTYNFSFPIRQVSYTFSFPTYQSITQFNFSYPIRQIQYNFTYPSNQNELVTQYTYNTRMKIWSAVSGSVVSQAWDNAGNSSGFITSSTNTITFDPAQFIGIYTLSATTSNNTVTARAYNSGGSQIGSTLTKTFASPNKSNANNETSAGIIKAHSANNVGTLYDNLSIA